ncbi:MAG: WD40 repeat domain-containing protein, partial [Bacteroidota bacterium]
SQWEKIVNKYDGNPRILKSIAATIKDLFDSDIDAFIAQGIGFNGDVKDLHSQQFERLSSSEKTLVFWLAIKREAVSVLEVVDDYISEGASWANKTSTINEALKSLNRCSFIESYSGKFTLQNGILEYVTEKFVANVCQEIRSGNFKLLKQHFLIHVSGKDYIRESQIRLILKPISEATVESGIVLDSYLDRLRDDFSPSYLAGNIINLLCYEKERISNYNYSNLYIRQAYFRGKALHHVNLANSHLRQCAFNQAIGNILSLAISPDDKYLAIGDDENKIFVISIENGEVVKRFDYHQDWIRSLSFNFEGNLLISGSSDSKLRIWEIESEECIDIIQDDLNRIRIAVFGKTSNLVAYAGKDDGIDVMEAANGTSEYRKIAHFPGHSGGVKSIAFSPDDRLIASCGNDCAVKVWNLETEELVNTFNKHTNWINSVCFSHDGRLLVTGSDDRTVKVWNLETEELVETFDEHLDEVKSVAFHPNDSLIASAGGDKTIRIWDLKTRECVRILEGHHNGVNKISFCLDGIHLV